MLQIQTEREVNKNSNRNIVISVNNDYSQHGIPTTPTANAWRALIHHDGRPLHLSKYVLGMRVIKDARATSSLL